MTRLNGVLSAITNSDGYKEIEKGIKTESFPVGVYGLSSSSKAAIIYSVFEKEGKNIFIFTSSDVEAKYLYEDLSFYTPRVYFLPTKEVAFYNTYAVSGDLRWERLKVINEMQDKKPKIIIGSVENLTALYCNPEDIKKSNITLKVETEIDIEDFNVKLIQSGYDRVDIIDSKGQFSIRGGIIDVYPPTSTLPYRIELFGDEIDSIRTFNIESQRSIEKVKKITIFPAKELILTEEIISNAIEKINKDYEKARENLIKRDLKDAAEKLKATVTRNIENLKEKWNFESIDSYFSYFYEKSSTLLDYTKNSLIFIDNVDRSIGKLDSVYTNFIEDYKSFLDRGDILPKQGEILIEKQRIVEELSISRVLTISELKKTQKILPPRSMATFTQMNILGTDGDIERFVKELKDKKDSNYKVIVLSGTRARGERFAKNLVDYDLSAVYKDKLEELHNGEIVITFGSTQESYEFPDIKLAILSDKAIFGEKSRKVKRKAKNIKGAGKIKSFTEIKPGDYVVHVTHGIGVYKGIKQLEVEKVKKDYLVLSYTGSDTLYVPVEQLDLVQKFIGTEGKAPKVSKLGGGDWQKAKNKARKAINEIAQDLVKLYATRAAIKGYSFSKDTPWQRQFEAEFPFEETPDQLKAIEEIKADMETDKPMDRLVCGDVGYGKTEVAIRAAFKAVMDNKQVAVLVPTTILAEQHFKTFKKRFEGFPVRIEMISRFRTAAQVKKILQQLKEGNLDILIGSHKILGKSVEFKDLGLLIVDEEQRFGVSHKEKIKNIKKNIDVLTLSATPIPRTLHMSLTGVRGISTIETPPEERYPVQTYVVEYNDQLIRDAILKEVNRGGQVFFVYNRVETIVEMSQHLSKLIPEARFIVAHGQMNEKELENVMIQFMNKDADVLIATTIIETGIDIQNANTIIINNADKMGLSQLYQLRGRVGRTNRIAYAYLTYRKDKILTEVAEKRLKAIKDFTELGSGFKVALRDLEIRGAGNIMGSSQHGQMASIGYDLYCKMLEDTIRVIKGEIEEEPIETVIEIKINAFIPSHYIEDEVQKIEVYKKIASIESKEELMDVRDEIIDRFSDIPTPVNNLMEIAYTRSIAKKLNIIEVKDKYKEIELTFSKKEDISGKIIDMVLSQFKDTAVLRPDRGAVISYLTLDREDILKNFREFLEYILENVES